MRKGDSTLTLSEREILAKHSVRHAAKFIGVCRNTLKKLVRGEPCHRATVADARAWLSKHGGKIAVPPKVRKQLLPPTRYQLDQEDIDFLYTRTDAEISLYSSLHVHTVQRARACKALPLPSYLLLKRGIARLKAGEPIEAAPKKVSLTPEECEMVRTIGIYSFGKHGVSYETLRGAVYGMPIKYSTALLVRDGIAAYKANHAVK